MYKKRKILALICARGGSKGTPYKNIKPLLGKPLIAWTIEQAKDSKYIDRIIVSTDDSKIAEISRKYGAEVPFMRPKELARDTTPIFKVILHAINFFEKEKNAHDVLLLLECTSPARYKDDIDNLVSRLIDDKNADSIRGVVEASSEHPLWSFKLANGYLVQFVPDAALITNMNRQLLEKAYLPYSIYAAWWDRYKKYKTFDQPRTLPYMLKKEQKVDIDDEADFYLAECILKKYFI